MSTSQLIVIAVAVFVAAFAQIIVGFGFGLLSMPIMTLAVPVSRAVVVSTLLGIMTTTWQAWHLRADADRPLVKRLSLAAFAGMPLGLWILNVVTDRALRLTLGVSILTATALLVARVDLHHIGRGFDVVLGFLSGVLNTSLSTNGPPLAFDLQARQLPPHRFRATIASVFFLSNIVGLTLFVLDGRITSTGVNAAVIALPAWLGGQLLGWPVRTRLNSDHFRRVVLALLSLAGATTIVFAIV